MALAEMARVSTRNDPERKKAAEAHKDYKPAPSASSELTGDLVLFDAIKWDDLSAFEEWAKMRLDDDLTALQDIKTEPAAQREADRREYLVKKSQKLRGYYSTGSAYGAKYKALQTYIDQWFREHEAELAPLGVAGCLHANFSVMNPVSGSHEELMRGTKAGQSRVKEAGKPRENAGSILAAIEALHPDYTTCPPMGDLLTKPEEIKPKAKAKPEGAVEEEKKPATVGPAPAVSRIVDENLRVQRSQTEDLDKGFKAGGKGEVFNLLRQWGSSGPITIVDDVSYQVEEGQVFGVAGESGSGKTISVLALLRLLPAGARVDGRALYDGRDLLALGPRALRDVQRVARLDGGTVLIAVGDPTDLVAADDLRIVLGTNVRVAVASPSQLEVAIARAYRPTLELTPTPLSAEGEERVEDIRDLASSAPAINLVNQLLTAALDEGASDLHFEPRRKDVVVRVRVDGVMRELATIPKHMQPAVTSRLKVMGSLDIAERRLPQDGRVSVHFGGDPIDLRIAVVPTTHGEYVVLRLATRQQGPPSLSELGMTPEVADVFRGAISQPYGAVIVCGPTGSGKTTTLYAALSILHDRERVAMTIEDPVEY